MQYASLKPIIAESRKICGSCFHPYLCRCRTGMVIIMARKWIVPVLAVLLLLCTSRKIPDIEMPDAPPENVQQAGVTGKAPPVLNIQNEAPETDRPEAQQPEPKEETGPKILTALETAPVLTAEQLPDSYNGLELPVQGATGYTSVYLPLWRSPSDSDAAQQAVAEWKKREEVRRQQAALEEAQRKIEEAARQAAAASTAATTDEADPEGSPAPSADGTEAPATPAADTPEAPPAEGTTEAAESASPSEAAPAPESAPAEPAPAEHALAEPAPGPEPPADPEPSPVAGAMAMLPSGTDFTILEEQGKWWKVQCTADYQEDGEKRHGEIIGWVEHRYCLINLPDVIPSMIYNATNGYSSVFVSCGKPLKNITGKALYTGALTNQRLGQKEFMMPVLYAMAPRLYSAQRAALAQGNCLVLYEAYRPLETQTDVSRALKTLMNEDAEVKAAVNSSPWSIGWFIATGASNHQHGYAVDVSLARVVSSEERHSGTYRYIRVNQYDLYQMPTPIHELSRAAAAFTTPVGSNSTTAWKSAKLAPGMNQTAIALQGYCTSAELTPLASEWWHFNDLAARQSVLGSLGKGDFEIRSCRSTAPE